MRYDITICTIYGNLTIVDIVANNEHEAFIIAREMASRAVSKYATLGETRQYD